jgi:CheY-like chemotaxis protein
MPKGGKPKIETRAVHLKRSNGDAAARSGDHVLLTFADSGEGIAPEEISRIFQPFESKLGEGSIFKLHLPVSGRPKKQISSSHTRETRAVGGSETLLLVEDEDPLREATAEFLRSIGYKVSSARTGEEALENLRAGCGKFDLLVSDVVMPHMSGPRLAEITASRWPQVKMLFLSGYGESIVLQKGLLDLNEHFLQKPFPMPLLAALRAATAASAG